MPRINNEMWTVVQEYIKSKPLVCFNDECNAYLCAKKKSITVADFDNFIAKYFCVDDCDFNDSMEFDEYFYFSTSVSMVNLNKENWILSDCICKDFFKQYLCKHILFVAILSGSTSIPLSQKRIPKRKRREVEKLELLKCKKHTILPKPIEFCFIFILFFM